MLSPEATRSRISVALTAIGRHVQHSQAGDFGTQGIKLTTWRPLNLRGQLHKLSASAGSASDSCQVCRASAWSSPISRMQRRTRIFRMQFAQGVYGVAGTSAPGFARIHLHFRNIGKGQGSHGQAVFRRTQGSSLVPRMPGRYDQQLVQRQLSDGGLGQRHMREVRWVKRPPEHANAQGAGGRSCSNPVPRREEVRGQRLFRRAGSRNMLVGPAGMRRHGQQN